MTMCAVSAVSDYYMQPRSPFWPNYTPPSTTPVPVIDEETKAILREIVKKLDEVDKKLGDRECMDAKKEEFFKVIGYTVDGIGDVI